MNKVLILYATREGQTEKIAQVISTRLQEGGLDVTLLNAGDQAAVTRLKLGDFNLLVFGASLHAWKIEKEMANFINRNKEEISNKPSSFFLVSLSAATRDKALREKSINEAKGFLQKQLQISLDEIEMVAGALLYTQYSWLMRWIMKSIAKKNGGDTDTSRDYEYTDWQQVDSYAHKLASRLR